MSSLSRHPRVIKLANDLGLPTRGDCLAAIRDFAIAKANQIASEAPLPVDSLGLFRRMVADKLRVKLEFICDDDDVERIAKRYADFSPELGQRLRQEFLEGTTEGITLRREEWDPLRFRYLAVVDARGTRAARAYFTAWHELTHLMVHPAQLSFPGFRRTPLQFEIEKDPIESVVDSIAGYLGFFPGLFSPILNAAIRQNGGQVTFRALESARAGVDPLPSLFSTAMGSLHLLTKPLLLVEADLGYKRAEARHLRSGQGAFDFIVPAPPKLRVIKAVPNALAKDAGVAIRANMRVPRDSILARAFESSVEVDLTAIEDQAWWETTREGHLPILQISVHAVRRGRFVYGLISTVVT